MASPEVKIALEVRKFDFLEDVCFFTNFIYKNEEWNLVLENWNLLMIRAKYLFSQV